VVLAIVAMLLSIVTPRYFGSISRAEESALKENLHTLRDAIDKHLAEPGRFPGSRGQLQAKRYIRLVPDDPVTKSAATWAIVPPPDPALGGVFDIKRGAKGARRNRKPYEEW